MKNILKGMMIKDVKAVNPLRGQPYDLIKVKRAPNKPCKKCNKDPRRDGSAYCGNCSIKHYSGL